MEAMSSDATSSDSSLDPHNDAAAAQADDGSTGQMVEDVESTAAELEADGASRGTLRDVANSLGISSAVALRALRGADEIKPRMVERVREAAERLHFPLEELSG